MSELVKIRIGNDVRITPVLTAIESGQPISWTDGVKKVIAFSDEQRLGICLPFEVADGVLSAFFKAERQRYIGNYHLIVEFDDGNKATWDAPAFCFVTTTGDASPDLQGIVAVEIEGTLQVSTGGGGGSVDLVDNLTSERTDAALTAKQGKVLKGMVDGKMPYTDLGEVDDPYEVMGTLTETGNYVLHDGDFMHSFIVFTKKGYVFQLWYTSEELVMRFRTYQPYTEEWTPWTELLTENSSVAWGKIWGDPTSNAALKALLDGKVSLNGNEIISGFKTFADILSCEIYQNESGTASLVFDFVADGEASFRNQDNDELIPLDVADPTRATHAATKDYVDKYSSAVILPIWEDAEDPLTPATQEEMRALYDACAKAVTEGKSAILNWGDVYAPVTLVKVGDAQYNITLNVDDFFTSYYISESNGTYHFNAEQRFLLEERYRTQSISGAGATDYIPSTKAVVDYVGRTHDATKQDKDFVITLTYNNGWVTDKTYAEARQAYNEGRRLLLYYTNSNFVVGLGGVTSTKFNFRGVVRTFDIFVCDFDANGISNVQNTIPLQNANHRIGNGDWQSTTYHYPSTAAVDARFVPKEMPLITEVELTGTTQFVDLPSTFKHIEIYGFGLSSEDTSSFWVSVMDGNTEKYAISARLGVASTNALYVKLMKINGYIYGEMTRGFQQSAAALFYSYAEPTDISGISRIRFNGAPIVGTLFIYGY